MSLTASTARAHLRGAPVRDSAVRQLRVVSGRIDTAGSGMFAAFCGSLLLAGLLSVLLLNTFLAKGAFVLDDLQAHSGELADTQEALQRGIDAQSAPAVLAQRAMQLGMVPSTSAAFLRLSDGKVLGVAKPAQKVAGFSVVTAPAPAPAAAKAATAAKPGPTKVVTTSGTVTTTTVTTPKADGSVVKTMTSVDSTTKTTTVTTVTTPAPAKPATTPTATPSAAPKPAANPTAGAN